MAKATKELGPCQVRIKTDNPCLRPAVVEIQGVPFCERCAREQEAYFAIGELTQEEARSLRGEPLGQALERMQRERAGRVTATEMEPAKVAAGDPE